MILAIDVGNTNMVFGCIDSGKVVTTARTRTDTGATWAEYAITMEDIFELFGIDRADFDGAIISSVAPQVTEALAPAVEKLIGTAPLIVDSKMNTGMKISVDDPSSVAGDLLTGGAGALACYGAPCIIVDLGTATTVTVVNENSEFIGGAIAPGVRLSLNALSSGTSLLPAISLTAPDKAISANTVDCMRSGLVIGTACMIDGMIDRFNKELGYECKVVATGGLAPTIIKYCSHEIICDENLLMNGLWAIYQKNK